MTLPECSVVVGRGCFLKWRITTRLGGKVIFYGLYFSEVDNTQGHGKTSTEREFYGFKVKDTCPFGIQDFP